MDMGMIAWLRPSIPPHKQVITGPPVTCLLPVTGVGARWYRGVTNGFFLAVFFAL